MSDCHNAIELPRGDPDSAVIAHNGGAPMSEMSLSTVASAAQPVVARGAATMPGADDGLRAIAAALSLCAFLWLLKTLLICWYVLAKKINPMSDAPLDGALAIGGEDVI